MAVLAIVGVVFLALSADSIYLWWSFNSSSSKLNRSMGIETGFENVRFPEMTAPESVFMIRHVKAGGLADKAGIYQGDIPISLSPCVHYLPPEGYLYAILNSSRGGVARICVVNERDVAPGWREKVRWVSIAVPGKTTGHLTSNGSGP